MKKKWNSLRFKKYNNKKSLKSVNKRNKKYIPNNKSLAFHINIHNEVILSKNLKAENTVKVPSVFSIIDNTEECLSFFTQIRNDDKICEVNSRKYIVIDLKEIQEIDYGAISILTAISYELSEKGVNIRGSFPEDEECKKFIVESGFLDNMTDEKGRNFKKNKTSEIIYFQKSTELVDVNELKLLSKKVKEIMKFLTGVEKNNQKLRSLILEMCGNSIEHSRSINNYWLLGVKYDKNKVIITVTDIGVGIIETLFKKFMLLIKETFTLNHSDKDVLEGAFVKKYGSSTKDINRNRGLPFIKETFVNKNINNLVVITNSVFLHFSESDKSRVLQDNTAFKGTFYQLEIENTSNFN